jgi:hypothetical protein
VPDDRLAAAVAELYGAAPEAFTGRRGELAAAARAAGDRAAAKAIGALRRPTRAAWVVNRLARADPGAASRLGELAAALRGAQEARDGRRLRELSVERDRVIDGLTARSLDVAGVADPPAALRFEVSQTLTAALADPEVAGDFAAGTLTRAEQWSGFGMLPADAGSGADDGAGAEPGAAGTRRRSPPDDTGTARSRSRSRADAPSQAAADGGGTGKAGTARAEKAAERRQAAEAERAAREAAERAARRREQYKEAERSVAAASRAAAEAAAAEDRLEAEVHDLETRLGKARPGLEAARLRARRAEAAERRARQALERLPRE